MVTKYQEFTTQLVNSSSGISGRTDNGHGNTAARNNGHKAHAVGRRRSSIQIIRDMLKVGENGAGKTEIMYSANMSYSQLQKYLSFLISQGFIDRVEVGNPIVTYQVTEQGRSLLKSIDAVLEVLELEDAAYL